MDFSRPFSLTLPLPELRQQYLISPDITFLNHGSFGACPRPVFDTYQQWQRELESNPVVFLGHRLPELLAGARAKLAAYLGAEAGDLAFVPNATYGINVVARSLVLKAGDEVLASDHEYGAVDRTWRFNCERQGATYINQPIPVPVSDAATMADQLWAGVTDRTKVIVLSHVTSPSALIMPVEEICRRARAAGILTVIDGAHAPGQVELNLEAIGADFYVGNCHKWMGSPKGAGFLHAHPERQALLEPFVVSHGWRTATPGLSQFLDYFTWVGTDDPAAYLSVPAAIDFQAQHNWPAVRAACHALALEAEQQILALSGAAALSGEDRWVQMRAVPLPGAVSNYARLWEEYRIVVPIFEWKGQTLIRVSIQAYNSSTDVAHLLEALSSVTR
jgi:isopenicillin-N epimerase